MVFLVFFVPETLDTLWYNSGAGRMGRALENHAILGLWQAVLAGVCVDVNKGTLSCVFDRCRRRGVWTVQ